MAVSYPLSIGELVDRYDYRDGWVRPMWVHEVSRDQRGVEWVKEMGDLLWHGFWQTKPMPEAEAIDLEVRLLSMLGGIHSFEGYDALRPRGVYDDGVSFDLSACTLDSWQTNNPRIKIAGLPNDYELRRGDWISIDDGTNKHLHQMIDSPRTVTAGVSQWAEIMPAPRREHISVGDPVTLVKAPALWRVKKETISRNRLDTIGKNQTVSWEAVQVLT